VVVDLNMMEITVNRGFVFLIRMVMGAAFGVFLSKVFYPKAPIVFIVGLCSALVVLAYVTEYLRRRSKQKSMGGTE
jgi:membrane protein implicated in regulation of membrane protease activity